ncbi:hypothetical protein MAPG_02112 [Magnaporthiopsis poae ATCC 64411]|uniref:Uncharacterized protein n=1 Tax=Magnaporthiopsis poae (strain ATCC 64411 / 73-15) TaxID=644358 RepID=A0A0C4DQH2_MAGP6|nr:hypothetical protein MAPG_02112 [Magnaporthiopsis poae ATCC 64411]
MATDSDNSSSAGAAGKTPPNSSVPASLCDKPINTAKDDSLAAAASGKNTDDEEPAKPPLVLPDWFLANNVTLFDDMLGASSGVRFLRSDDGGGKETPIKDENGKNKADESGDVVDYELQQGVYDEILDLVSVVVQPPPSSAPKPATAAWAEAAAVILQSPRQGSLRFLEHIARRIALDLHADLVSFDYKDIADLSVNLWDAEADGERWKSEDMKLTETVFCSDRREEVSTAAFEAILGGAQRKLSAAHVDEKKDVVPRGTNEDEVLPDTTLDKSPESEAAAGKKEHQAPTDNLANAEIHKPGAGKPQVIGDETQGQNREAQGQMEETQGRSESAEGKDEEAPGKKGQQAGGETPCSPCSPSVGLAKGKAFLSTPLQGRRRPAGGRALTRSYCVAGSIFILATEISPRKWSATPKGVQNVWGGLEIKQSTCFNLTPRHTKRAREALKSHAKESILVNNWRWICRAIRCALLDAGQDAVAYGLLSETLKQGERHRLPDQLSEDAREILDKWKKKETTSVVRQVCARARRPGVPPLEAKDVYDIMARTQCNIKLLKASRKADGPFEDEGGAGKKEEKEKEDEDEEEEEEEEKKNKSKVQELLDEIRDGCRTYEKQLMSCVVDIGEYLPTYLPAFPLTSIPHR